MYNSMLIQGSSTNSTFEWINPYKYRNPTITSITVLFRSNQVMFTNVDTTNVVTNTNDDERTIPPGYYSIGDIIPILKTMTDTMFSISTKASSLAVSEIQSSHTPSISPLLRSSERSPVLKANSHSSCFVLWLERD